MRQYGVSYFKDFWNCIDLTQFGAFIYLFISKLVSQFKNDTFMDILFSAIILFLSIYKLMYYVRIYQPINEIILIVTTIVSELIPFATLSVTLLFALSKIYQVLHMGVNDPQQLYKQINSELIRMFMQTIKLSTGDKTPPTLDDVMTKRLEQSESTQNVFIFFLEVVWAL